MSSSPPPTDDGRRLSIPSVMAYDRNLPPRAAFLYATIEGLAKEKGYCYASNSYFAKLYGINKSAVVRLLGALRDSGYIEIEHSTDCNYERRIYITYPHEKNFTPHESQKHLPKWANGKN